MSSKPKLELGLSKEKGQEEPIAKIFFSAD